MPESERNNFKYSFADTMRIKTIRMESMGEKRDKETTIKLKFTFNRENRSKYHSLFGLQNTPPTHLHKCEKNT